jgi:hypothetical protein
MELQGDVGQVESRFNLLWDSLSVGARYVHDLHQRAVGLEIILDPLDGTLR